MVTGGRDVACEDEDVEDLKTILKEKSDLVENLERAVEDLEDNLETTRGALVQERKRRLERERRFEVELVELGNLKRVLEDFEAERENEASMVDSRLKESRLLEQKADEENQKIKAELKEAVEDRDRLQSDVRRWQNECLQAREGLLAMKDEVEKTLGNSREEDKIANSVDRRVVRQLVVGSFQKSGEHRREVLELMSKVLELSEEERLVIGLDANKSLGSWLSAFVVPPPVDDPMPLAKLSEKWVEFLTKEVENGIEEGKSGEEGGKREEPSPNGVEEDNA
mmetsp:Transcript_3709/g.16284  ORF Transcript_3709/g.16284 Transcript_3709/m.16284 type:complete len:282 (-) Transcript_3709:605-1450(-)|eukprot:CAMPEP_0113970522 /NCGR_PEP_ID=MMETSP0011_2-20120614/11275_1 /TAXON_ID=101924 /ORGANISM="Rhodosorus marinus" /LENGTH=281 /DNA_ID=CAMNT_0000985011 /DNA_START=409 /DNA_END=1254 /DNA_ORIENTATION=+ /assembly_acc=CAM_ASM_000156